MIWLMAKVRINRFVQKGIVIKNSKKVRIVGLRVAMNQAVGNPINSEISVVKIDNFIDRQKIDKCASAI